MAEEKIEPPNERVGWKENLAKRERHALNGKIHFYEIRFYENVFVASNLFTFSFFDGEVILKGLIAAGLPKTVNSYYFLKLDGGTWVRSVLNRQCNFHMQKDKENSCIKVTIIIQTPGGIRTRTLIKKI